MSSRERDVGSGRRSPAEKDAFAIASLWEAMFVFRVADHNRGLSLSVPDWIVGDVGVLLLEEAEVAKYAL
jgi:hypothetical protein